MASATRFVQKGVNLDYVNSSGSDIAYLQIIPLTERIVIALSAIPAGETGAVTDEGVWEIPAKNTEAFSFGDPLYWDNTNHYLTKTAAGHIPAGIAAAAKAQTDTTALINLEELSTLTPAG